MKYNNKRKNTKKIILTKICMYIYFNIATDTK